MEMVIVFYQQSSYEMEMVIVFYQQSSYEMEMVIVLHQYSHHMRWNYMQSGQSVSQSPGSTVRRKI